MKGLNLPLLRKPQTWRDWAWDSLCLVPMLFIFFNGFGLSAPLLIVTSVAVQLGAAWRISRINLATKDKANQDD